MEAFRRRLISGARKALASYPEMQYASISGIAPNGVTYTAYAKREIDDLSAWIREAGGVEPEEHERDRRVVAEERNAAEAGRKKRVKKEPDPRIFGQKP